MALENTILLLDVLVAVIVFFVMILIVKSRVYERYEFERVVNALLFGMLFLLVIFIINLINGVHLVYPEMLAFLGENVGTYIGHLVTISKLALFPLFAVCFLVAVLFARDSLQQYE